MNVCLEPPEFQQGPEHAARHDRTSNALMRSQDADETQIRTNAVGVRNIGEMLTRRFEAAKLLDLSLRLTAGTPGTGGGGVRLCFPLGMSLRWKNLRSSKLSRSSLLERVRCEEELLFEWRLTHPKHRGINRIIDSAAHI
jgi:hypothetical protein